MKYQVKNRVNYLIPILLIVAILFFVVRERSPFGSRNTSFAVKDKQISRIVFFEEEKKLTLSRSGDEWVVNGGGEARKVASAMLVSALKNMVIKSTVSSDAFRNEIVSKQVKPVRVNIYGRVRLLKSFLVYRTSSNKYGNIMKMRAGAKPFIVWLPGSEENIGQLFTAEENFWRPFDLFRSLPGRIEEVSVLYPSDTAASFILRISGNTTQLFSGDLAPLNIDSARARRYYSYYTSVRFESWVKEERDSLRQTLRNAGAVAVISVREKGGTTSVLELFEKISVEKDIRSRDSDRIYGILNKEDDIYIIRYFDIDPLLKKRKWLNGEI